MKVIAAAAEAAKATPAIVIAAAKVVKAIPAKALVAATKVVRLTLAEVQVVKAMTVFRRPRVPQAQARARAPAMTCS